VFVTGGDLRDRDMRLRRIAAVSRVWPIAQKPAASNSTAVDPYLMGESSILCFSGRSR
jgi:hypothetical protein